MKIIRYKNTADITIEFQDEHKVQRNTTYRNFSIGQISNPYDRTNFGIGYVGEGKYPKSKNGLNIPPYSAWRSILERCCVESYVEKFHKAYEGCEVCDEWLNYQNFADWYYNNFYDIGDGKRMHIDKDILVKGNRLYAPDRCLIVPQRINMIFMEKQNKYGLPNGIHITINGKYQSQYNTKYLGVYENLEDAISIHNIEKEKHIKRVADEYKDKLPPKVYQALYNWKA